MGRNGMGKTTLFKSLMGILPLKGGHIEVAGNDVSKDESFRRVAKGIAYVPQGRQIFPGLTVRENMMLGATSRGKLPRKTMADDVEQMFGIFPDIKRFEDALGWTLSGGQQQMLAVSKAIMLEPELLLIDELSLGLAPLVVQELLEVVEGLKRTGVTMVIVEQSVNVALSIADRAVFMERGRVRFEGAASDLLDRDDLLRAVFLSGEGA